MKFHDLPLGPTVEALRSGSLDLLAFCRDVLARIEEAEPQVEALIPETGRAERLLGEAEALKAASPDPATRPPLFGVPVGIKDLIRVDGHPTRAGSALPAEAFEGPQASLVTRILDAGALVIGKTATDEFAYADPPPTKNPHDLARTPGGSSAGSAVLTALGLSPLCVGTQTARSVIAPASFCGVFALKPSHGRLPADGVFPLSPSMDVPGLFTQDPEGLAFAASVLLDDGSERDAGTPVLGLPSGPYVDGMPDEGWKEPHGEWMASLKTAGVPLRDVPLGWSEDIPGEFAPIRAVLNFEMARAHEGLFGRYQDLYRKFSRMGVEYGRKISEEDYRAGKEAQERFRADITAWMDAAEVNALLLPAQPGPASLLTRESTGWGYTTAPWSFAGLPCVTLPAGTAEGLPLGLQLIARFGEDEKLLGWMKAVWAAVGEPL
jgi:Asp-tRNA(Asn)/Glu-tRNA(Gln) amidotransferase A subunit family amidase